MGIPGPGKPLETSQSTFSDDLLSIELCGPDKQNLSIIDIPGIFRTPTEGVTTVKDMALVRRIMNRHIKDDRTIILAVIPSNTDIATQEILSIAKELDPNGLRTLGVLTKPDLIDKGGEENVMSLVEGKRNFLRLGYCIVRNRGQSELSSTASERQCKEKDFFTKEPWSRLDRDRVGTPALQRRLQELLVSLTRREFPKVQAQMMKRLSACRERLDDLGADRESADQQRRFLLEISHKFQVLTNCALDAYYSRDSVFTSVPKLRIATLAIERMELFAQEIDRFGHTVNFNSEDEEDDATAQSQMASNTTSQTGSEADAEDSDVEYREISDFIVTKRANTEPSDRSIMGWIEEEYRQARGFGLATIGPSILPTIWQEQSKNWESLTLAYIADIVHFVHDFTCKALAHVCPDEGVRSSLWLMLQELLIDRYRTAQDHVKFIIRVEKFGTPLTTNHYFNENLQRCKAARLEKVLEKDAEFRPSEGFGSAQRKFVGLDRIKQSMAMKNSEYAIQDIHDILESYYKVAKKRFVDTVCMQGSDFYLLTGPDSPLRIFGTAFVSELSPAQLDLIAGEGASVKQLRKSLKNEIASLEKGKRLLRM